VCQKRKFPAIRFEVAVGHVVRTNFIDFNTSSGLSEANGLAGNWAFMAQGIALL
jgi:hypothetical protein